MLSQDVSVKAAGVDAQFLRHDVAEAGRVQVGPATNDTVLWQAAQLPGHVGQNIHCMNRQQRFLQMHYKTFKLSML